MKETYSRKTILLLQTHRNSSSGIIAHWIERLCDGISAPALLTPCKNKSELRVAAHARWCGAVSLVGASAAGSAMS